MFLDGESLCLELTVAEDDDIGDLHFFCGADILFFEFMRKYVRRFLMFLDDWSNCNLQKGEPSRESSCQVLN